MKIALVRRTTQQPSRAGPALSRVCSGKQGLRPTKERSRNTRTELSVKAQLSRLAGLICAVLASAAYGQINPTDPPPPCTMPPGSYVPLAPLDAYTYKA